MKKLLLVLCVFFVSTCFLSANDNKNEGEAGEPTEITTKSRLTLGGYGEAAFSRMFYSDNYKRYSSADLFKDAKSHEIGRAHV